MQSNNEVQSIFIAQFCWALSNTGVKLSILDMSYKVFKSVKPFRFAVYALHGLCVAFCLMVILVALLICKPVEFNWTPTLPNGSCADQTSAFTASGVINLLLDIAIIVLPMPLLWNLQMATHKKVGLMVIFSVGVL